MLSDIEIAQKNNIVPVSLIAQKIALSVDDIELYGKYKAKLTMQALRNLQSMAFQQKNRGKLILVTAITPTPAGEGKSTVSIGLGDALRKIGKNAVIALREPSLGPCFGVKGGACGGGYAQIVPMEDINLHFTGDIHAVSSANNLISAIIDNSLQHGNPLEIDPRTITWNRCVDLNDRVLRSVVVGLGGRSNGVPREESFRISVASEIMAILCLSRSISELKNRITNITVAQTFDKRFVKFGEFCCTGAVATLLKDAIRPNLVQTLEQTPVFVHGGPFANIAHGCNSVNATLCALACADYVVTEAGFAADLGAEKFFNIKCRVANLRPDACVIVATVRALKMHGGVAKTDLDKPDLFALEIGFSNLVCHIENIAKFGVHSLVAINRFCADTKEEIDLLKNLCVQHGVKAIETESYTKGSNGSIELAENVVKLCDLNVSPDLRMRFDNKARENCEKVNEKKNSQTNGFHFLYDDTTSLVDKIKIVATEIYRAKSVKFSSSALKKLELYASLGYSSLPVCIAKTQNSISHDPALKGAPCDYIFPVTDVQLYSGAGFVVALAEGIMTMPGLPEAPAALKIDVNDDGVVSGLF